MKSLIVPVNLGDRSYTVRIGSGLRHEAGKRLKQTLGDAAATVVVVSNPVVWNLYGAEVEASLAAAGIKTMSFLMPDGERFKNLRTAEKLWSFLIEHEIERRATLLALGGGVVGDLTGFVAATYQRGIPFVQMPTTLLAQIDSSVGGKTAVNHPLGKNLIGAFHQPALVLVDTDTLATLPQREWNAGWCEALKYGVIRDAAFFDRLDGRLPFPPNGSSEWSKADNRFLSNAIARCCELKAEVVAADERETGLRKILNFGHTVGHAIEAVTRYRTFRHGEAVGYGMIAECEIGAALGLCPPDVAVRVSQAVHRVGKLPHAAGLDTDEIIAAMRHDKKKAGGRVRMILPTRMGEVVERPAPDDDLLRAAIERGLA